MKPHLFLHCGLLLGLCMLVVACAPERSAEPHADTETWTDSTGTVATWTVATWNMEHLAYPPTDGCKPRAPDEIAGLRAYAASINADIVGLQEVASINALQQIFPADAWQLVISERPDSEPYECRESGFTSTQQKVAWAVRRGIDIANVKTLDAFGLDLPGLRHGLEIQVASPWGDITLLNVHMKSGCFVDDYSRKDSEACEIFARQAPVLDGWVEQRERAGTPYLMLGDFNHRLSAPYNLLTRQLNTNSDGSRSTLVNTTAQLIGCHPYYPAPIDHIFAGHLSEAVFTAGVVPFEDMTVDGMLSDHCAMTLTLDSR